MSPAKPTKPHPILQWPIFSSEHFPTINDVELATLKIHLFVEDALRYLLAVRLGISYKELETLSMSFNTTSTLALAGKVADPHLVGGIRALQKARNNLSHSIESADVQEQLGKFVSEIGSLKKKKLIWPSSLPEQLKVLQDSLDEVADAIFTLAKWNLDGAYPEEETSR